MSLLAIVLWTVWGVWFVSYLAAVRWDARAREREECERKCEIERRGWGGRSEA